MHSLDQTTVLVVQVLGKPFTSRYQWVTVKTKGQTERLHKTKSLVWQQTSISLVTWLTLCLVYLLDNSERRHASSLLEKRKREKKRERGRERKRK